MAEAEMSDLQIIAIAFFVIGLIAFFYGEPFAIKLLLAWLTWQWINDQPDRALAMVQAGLAWALWVVLGRVLDAAYRMYRVRAWRRMVAEIDRTRAQFQRAGLDFELEMANAGLRHARRQWERRCLGLED